MLTTEEIEYTIGEAFRQNQSASLRFEEPGLGRVAVDVDELNGATLIRNAIQTERKPLRLPCRRLEPTIVMYFQLKGGSQFSQARSVWVPESHHALNFYPELKTTYAIGEQSRLSDLVVKLTPAAVTTHLQVDDGAGSLAESWLRLLESGEPFTTVQESRPMAPHLPGLLNQLMNCPYKGRLGQLYRESLVRVLFIEQLGIFRGQKPVSAPTDPKLTRRDLDILHDLKQHLEQHFLDEQSLEGLARQFGLNTFKLKYGFKKLFGTPVMRFVDDLKMNHARRLLLDEQQDAWAVADQLGYNHYTNFSAAFRRRFGHSPARLREQAYGMY